MGVRAWSKRQGSETSIFKVTLTLPGRKVRCRKALTLRGQVPWPTEGTLQWLTVSEKDWGHISVGSVCLVCIQVQIRPPAPRKLGAVVSARGRWR